MPLKTYSLLSLSLSLLFCLCFTASQFPVSFFFFNGGKKSTENFIMPRTTRNSLDAALPFSAELSSPGKIENKTVKKEQPKKVKPVKKASSSPQRKSLASAKAAKFESARRTHKPPTYPPKMSDLLSSGEHMPRKAFKDRVSRAISRRNILPNKILASGMKSGPNFPMKMHMVLELADEMEYSHVMSWTEGTVSDFLVTNHYPRTCF